MSRQDQLIKSINNLNARDGASFYVWVLLLLTSIADSLAAIADTLQDREEGAE